MPTTILDHETYPEALQRRYAEEAKAEERMTTKPEQAARQVVELSLRVEQDSEESLGEDGMVMVVPLDAYNDMMESIATLREAVTASGCGHCNNPLFAGTSCPNCGRVVEPDHSADAGNMVSDHIAASGKVIPQFIPVGIVNDHHSITWIEEIVEDQAPIGAILYALQDSVGRNVSFAKEQK